MPIVPSTGLPLSTIDTVPTVPSIGLSLSTIDSVPMAYEDILAYEGVNAAYRF